MKVPKRLGIALMGIAGLFGMRTPPEPEVIARTAPAPRPEDTRPPRLRRREAEAPDADRKSSDEAS